MSRLLQTPRRSSAVLIDLGHHALGTNIEHIVAFLIDEGKLGGFHFNNKKYADDDVSVGSINPYELFLIYNELVAAENDPDVHMNVAYMIDQSHNLKPKIEEMIQSVGNCQGAYARALLVDRKALREAQQNGDIVAAEELLQAAYQTDVRPLLALVRTEMGTGPDPLAAFRASGYLEKIRKSQGRPNRPTSVGLSRLTDFKINSPGRKVERIRYGLIAVRLTAYHPAGLWLAFPTMSGSGKLIGPEVRLF